MSELVVTVDAVSKKYCRGLRRSLLYGLRDIAVELVGGDRRGEGLRKGEFRALEDVSFSLRRGESLGLVGPNGSGKTTLLRILAGLIKPDTGTVRIRGRVAPLIALGAGFSPVLTGRENIWANLAILGLEGRQIERRFDAVLDFAEIGDAVDAPVRTYSSGMAARLGFACAIHTDPDLFLIDEVLAVGDLRFRLKCYRKLAELRERGTSFVLVSHNPHSILSICESALYLQAGRLRATGAAATVLQAYEDDLGARPTEDAEEVGGRWRRAPRAAGDSTGLDVVELFFRDAAGEPIDTPQSGEPVALCLRLEARTRLCNVGATVLVREQLGEGDWLLRLATLEDRPGFDLEPGAHELRLELPACGLRPGSYLLKLNVARGTDELLDAVEVFTFRVRSKTPMSQCAFFQPRSWRLATPEGT